MEEIKESFSNIVKKRMHCWLISHNWKLMHTFFYPVNRYPVIDKVWERMYKCSNCGLKIEPKFYNKSWRVKHQLAIFNEEDAKLNFDAKEQRSYNITKKIVDLLDRKQGVTT